MVKGAFPYAPWRKAAGPVPPPWRKAGALAVVKAGGVLLVPKAALPMPKMMPKPPPMAKAGVKAKPSAAPKMMPKLTAVTKALMKAKAVPQFMPLTSKYPPPGHGLRDRSVASTVTMESDQYSVEDDLAEAQKVDFVDFQLEESEEEEQEQDAVEGPFNWLHPVCLCDDDEGCQNSCPVVLQDKYTRFVIRHLQSAFSAFDETLDTDDL
jgi:hypothetical protein